MNMEESTGQYSVSTVVRKRKLTARMSTKPIRNLQQLKKEEGEKKEKKMEKMIKEEADGKTEVPLITIED